MGFGRSGTSLMAGILHRSGYFVGDDLYPPRESNPMGFFENAFINGINEKILSTYDYVKINNKADSPEHESSPFNPLYGQRWLSYIEPASSITFADDGIRADIQQAVSAPLYAYKDPRFNYTLPVWEKFLPDEVVYICMFRQPGVTAESVLKDCKSADYLATFHVDRNLVFELWYNSYQRVLQYATNNRNRKLIFVHYGQLLNMEAFPAISEKLEAELDPGFISVELNRSRADADTPRYAQELYERLCVMADFKVS